MEKIEFENGELVTGAYVTINGIDYPVQMPIYTGSTPLSAETFNQMQENIEEAIEGTILYENSTGTSSNITLNQSSANFSKMKIKFVNNRTNAENWVEVDNPNGKVVNSVMFYKGASYPYIMLAQVSISGTSITWDYNQRVSLIDGTETTDYVTNITKIIAFE